MKKQMEDIKQFKIADFYQAVILKTCGLQLASLERGSGKFVTFVFDDPDFQAEEILGRYWNGEIQANARTLIENINELKTRIYSKT